MQFLENDMDMDFEDELTSEEIHKQMLSTIDMQTAFVEISQLVISSECNSYLEASCRWLEERSIPEKLFAKYIPDSIVEKIKNESIEERLLRPSMVAESKQSDLGFLYG